MRCCDFDTGLSQGNQKKDVIESRILIDRWSVTFWEYTSASFIYIGFRLLPGTTKGYFLSEGKGFWETFSGYFISLKCELIVAIPLVRKSYFALQIVREKITWPGAQIRKKDEGLSSYSSNKKGILYITVDVEFPRGELTLEQKEVVEKLLKQGSFEPKVCLLCYSS